MDYETQRRLMCELGRRMWERGWVAANDGNFSRRLGEGLFLVTPAGVSKGFLTTDMLLVVDSQGRMTSPSSYRPSSETPLHLACYRVRPDVGGVCHAHPPAATAFACAHLGLEEPLLGEAVMSLGPVPCAPYGRTGPPSFPPPPPRSWPTMTPSSSPTTVPSPWVPIWSGPTGGWRPWSTPPGSTSTSDSWGAESP